LTPSTCLTHGLDFCYNAPLVVLGGIPMDLEAEMAAAAKRGSRQRLGLGDHLKAAIRYHFKTGHRETACGLRSK
jgi:hypothetical protein